MYSRDGIFLISAKTFLATTSCKGLINQSFPKIVARKLRNLFYLDKKQIALRMVLLFHLYDEVSARAPEGVSILDG